MARQSLKEWHINQKMMQRVILIVLFFRNAVAQSSAKGLDFRRVYCLRLRPQFAAKGF